MAYCDLANLAELGYTWQTKDETNITSICDTASKAIDAYCKQTFVSGSSVAEMHQARVRDGLIKIFPRNLTVSSIDSIVYKVIGSTSSYACADAIYVPYGSYILADTTAPNGTYLVTLIYSYGYASGSYPEEITKAAVLACAPLLDDYFLSLDANVSMVKSIKQGNLHIVREDTDKMPQNVIDILNGGNNGLGWVRVRAG